METSKTGFFPKYVSKRRHGTDTLLSVPRSQYPGSVESDDCILSAKNEFPLSHPEQPVHTHLHLTLSMAQMGYFWH